MKQLLSGNDWMVSDFLPDEVSAVLDFIPQIASGNLYGGCFIPATVPGDVQSDCLDAGVIEDINYGYNARKAEWTYQRDWVYTKRFTPLDESCRRVRLCFDGVDYECEVYLNGKWLGNHECAWIPFDFDVTDKLNYGGENSVQVIVKSAPKAEGQWGRTTEVRDLKARFNYAWDWCTRLVTLGIWKDVYLSYDKDANIDNLHVTTDVDYKTKKSTVKACLTTQGADASVDFVLKHPDGKEEIKKVVTTGNVAECEFKIDNSLLWYPNGMGEQPLYEITAILGDNWDREKANVGLRHIEWTRVEGAGEDAMPYQPYINGRRVYLQGYNFTAVRQLYGREHKHEYDARLALVKDSGANFLRVHGAGLLEREYFYDLCDRYGILVMQELFQTSSCRNNHPPRDKEYIDMMVRATESAVLQKRNHPSLIIWCGGNELCVRGKYITPDGRILIEGAEGNEGYTYDINGYHWVPLSGEYPTLKAMGEAVKRLDPGRMWFHTSGSGPVVQNAVLDFIGGSLHDVHGPWAIFGPKEFYHMYNAYDMMAHMEYGCHGSASVQALEAFMPEEYLWPLDEMNPMANYHGRMWANAKTCIEPYFGEFTDYKTYAHASRFIQWEQLRYSLEAHRRLGKRCAAACLWHMAEPWPNAADTCSIDAYDQPKPAFYGEKEAFKPLHIALKYHSVIHKDSFNAEVTLYNSTDKFFKGKVTVQLYDIKGNMLEEVSGECEACPDETVANVLSVEFKSLPDGVFFVRQILFDGENNEADRGYSIHSTASVPYKELLSQPQCKIDARLMGNTLKLKNCGEYVVSGLTAECDLNHNILFSKGCIMLLPDEETEIEISNPHSTVGKLHISGFGVPWQEIEK